MSKFKQGLYKPVNESKYEGDASKIVWRSSWEHRLFTYFDYNSHILSWQSEETVIPYYNPLDQKWHKYFVDAKAVIKLSPSLKKTVLIEVKPYKETIKPVEPKRKTQKACATYQTAIATYIKNQLKWEAATKYAKERGWEFIVLTEYQLFPSKLKK